MPFYYDINPGGVTTNGTAATETDHLRLLTSATQGCHIAGLYGGARMTTVGGALLRLKTFATASTSGTTFTPSKRNPGNPAAGTTAFTTPTAGTTPVVRVSIGIPQSGGTGGWFALEEMHALNLNPNGGANGNCDLYSIAVTAAVLLDYTLEFYET